MGLADQADEWKDLPADRCALRPLAAVVHFLEALNQIASDCTGKVAVDLHAPLVRLWNEDMDQTLPGFRILKKGASLGKNH